MTKIEQITANFNKLRVDSLKETFNHTDLKLLLSMAEIPYFYRLDYLIEVGAIIRPERGKYRFPEQPVHISKIKRFCDMGVESFRTKPVETIEVKSIEIDNRQLIEEAIQLLKNTGEYTIYKKVTTWEEVK